MQRTATHADPSNKLNTLLAVAVAALLLLAACGGGTSSPQALGAPPPPPATMSQPYVYKAELMCKEAGFKDHIHHGTAQSHSPIVPRDLRFTVSSLTNALGAVVNCDSGGDIDHAIVTHYGLDAAAQLDILLEVVCLQWDANTSSYTYASTNLCFAVNAGALTAFSGGLAAWYGTGGAGATYAQRVVIQRSTGSGWDPFDPAVDVTATLFPYEKELDLLIAQNGLGSSDSLRLVPCADPKSWSVAPDSSIVEKDFFQDLTWVCQGVTLDDIDHGAGREYENKGADLGSPCPVTCPNTKFVPWSNSAPRRPGC